MDLCAGGAEGEAGAEAEATTPNMLGSLECKIFKPLSAFVWMFLA